MRVDLLTREYPPHVYGGAGVHVAGLTRVSAHNQWILETAIVVPEPGLLFPACLALASFVCVRRRSGRPGFALYQDFLRSQANRLARVR